MLYIRLILIIVNLQIINRVQSLLSNHTGKFAVLSYRKTCQTMRNSFLDLLPLLRCSKEEAILLLGDIYRMLSKNHWREKRKKRENFIENMHLFICTSKK